MRHTRFVGICILAVAATACGVVLASLTGRMASARADTCNPLVLQCTSTGSGSTPPGGTTTPAKHINRAPGPVTGLHKVNTGVPGQITFAWTNPARLFKIVIRRGPAGQCPKTTSDGTQIGTTAVRTTQTDSRVGSVAYCYTVFAVNKAGQASLPTARSLAPLDVTPPSAPGNVAVSGGLGNVVITWTAATGNPVSYIVERGAASRCPSAVAPRKVVATVGTTSATDTTAAAGHSYCYTVFAVDKAKNASAAGVSQPFLVVGPTTPTPKPNSATPTATDSPIIPSELGRIVAAVAVAVIVFGVIVLGGLRILHGPRERDGWEYGGRVSSGSPRISLDLDARAMVIPAVIVVLGLLLLVAVAGVVL